MRSVQVDEGSGVAEARRAAVAEAEALGFDPVKAGNVAIVATELATNLVRHGGGGELLIDRVGGADGAVQLIAIDRGPGMADIERCFEDGYSTAGSPGTGLGAVRRLTQVLDIYSRPGAGTVVLARLGAAPRLSWGAIQVARRGERVCGDGYDLAVLDSGAVIMVADGLGHGEDAAVAAEAAVRAFRRAPARPPLQLLEDIHLALRPTRGAAVAVARIDMGRRNVEFAGLGNIAGVIHHDRRSKKTVSQNGTAGHVARSLRAFDYPFEPGGHLILFSDGLASHWDLDAYPGLTRHDPVVIAALLYREHTRRRDDVTVLVARLGGA